MHAFRDTAVHKWCQGDIPNHTRSCEPHSTPKSKRAGSTYGTGYARRKCLKEEVHSIVYKRVGQGWVATRASLAQLQVVCGIASRTVPAKDCLSSDL